VLFQMAVGGKDSTKYRFRLREKIRPSVHRASAIIALLYLIVLLFELAMAHKREKTPRGKNRPTPHPLRSRTSTSGWPASWTVPPAPASL
jgi:hypothetical protein